MSTATARNRFELLDYGASPDTWGDHWNANFAGIDEALDGVVDVDLTGAGHALTVADFVSHEARRRILRTRGGGVLTVPSIEKTWYVLAAAPFFATNGVQTVQVPAGFSVLVGTPLSVYSSTRDNAVPVHQAVAAITGAHAYGLAVVGGIVSIVLSPGVYVDVKASAAGATVGDVRFAPGASARLLSTDAGIVVLSESAGVSRG